MVNCPSCNKPIPGWARDRCPGCGSPIRKPKSSLIPILAIAGIVVIIAICAVYFVFILPPPGDLPNAPVTNNSPQTDQGRGSAVSFHSIPNIPISMQKQGANKIVVTNIGGPDTNTVSDFVVTVNGVVAPGKLGVTPGQSLIVTTASHPNNVIVTANFKDGTSFVVSNKNID